MAAYIMRYVAALAVLLAFAAPALAQQSQPVSPQGQPVMNQALNASALTKSDTTVFTRTRGVYIGDAAACNIAVLFSGSAAAVTLANVQPGRYYPFSIIKLMSTNTTCAAVTVLY